MCNQQIFMILLFVSQGVLCSDSQNFTTLYRDDPLLKKLLLDVAEKNKINHTTVREVNGQWVSVVPGEQGNVHNNRLSELRSSIDSKDGGFKMDDRATVDETRDTFTLSGRFYKILCCVWRCREKNSKLDGQK